jgi:hypothetical protein
MTLDQFANIAEITGVVIIVVTLIYLSVQLRQNTQALHSTGAQATHDALGTYYLALARDSELLGLFRAGTEDLSRLSDDESAQFFALWTYTLYTTQNWIYQQRTSALDDELTNSWLASVSDNFHCPGFQQYWKHRRSYFSKALQEYVEEVMAGPPTRAGYRVLGPSVERTAIDKLGKSCLNGLVVTRLSIMTLNVRFWPKADPQNSWSC